MSDIPGSLGDLFSTPQLKKKFQDKTIEQLVYEYQMFDYEIRTKEEETARLKEEQNQWITRYNELFDFAPSGFLILSPQSLILKANHAASSLLNLPSVLLQNKHFQSFIHPDSIDVFSMAMENVATQPFRQSFTITLLPEINHPVSIKADLIPLAGHWKESSVVLCAFVDITNEVKSQDLLQETKEQIHTILKTIPLAVYTVDSHCTITFWNQKAEEITGYSASEVLGKTCKLFSTGDCLDICSLFMKTDAAPVKNKTCTLRTKQGRLIQITKTSEYLKDHEGHKLGAIECFFPQSDKDESKNPMAESIEYDTSASQANDFIMGDKGLNMALRQTIELRNEILKREENLSALLSSIDDLVIEMNEDMEFTNVWGRHTEHLFFPKSEVIGKNIQDLLPQMAELVIGAIREAINSQNAQIIEYPHVLNPDIWYQAKVNPIINNDGLPGRKVSIFIRDNSESRKFQKRITDLNRSLLEQKKALEELNNQLEQKVKEELEKSRKKDELLQVHAKHAAIGDMIGNIAHQWRQPLNAINLMVYDIKDAYNHNELDQVYLENSTEAIHKIIRQMSETIDNFRSFFQPLPRKIAFDLEALIQKTLSFTDANFHSLNIQIEFISRNGIMVYGFPNEFSQVMLNILNNAFEAFKLKKEHLKDEISKVKIKMEENTDSALITISDNAGGIPDEIISQIFEPYFTTKSNGIAAGMGLFSCKSIIEKNMNGKISASNNDSGAVINISIPKANA